MAKKGVIGLDLGSQTIKAVELMPGKEGPVLTRVAVTPTPDGMIVNGVIIDPEMVGQAVVDLLSREGFTSKAVVSACGGQADMVIRVTEVPRMSEKELRNAMKWDLERHLPFPASQAKESVQFAVYEGPDVDPNSPNMEVTITVLKDENCEKHLKVLDSAKLRAQTIDGVPFAAGRALVTASRAGQPDRCVAVINIGAELTDISIIHHDWLRFNRVVPMAGNSFTTAVSQRFIVESQEAELLKGQYATLAMDQGPAREELPPDWGEVQAARPKLGMVRDDADLGLISVTGTGPTMVDTADGPMFADDYGEPAFVDTVDGPVFGDLGDEPTLGEDDTLGQLDAISSPARGADAQEMGPAETRRQVADALRPAAAELAAEVRRSVEYYRSRHDDVDVEKLVIIGGSARIADMARFLQEEVGIPAEVGNPFSAVALDPGAGYDCDYLAEVAPVVSVAVGLALHQWF